MIVGFSNRSDSLEQTALQMQSVLLNNELNSDFDNGGSSSGGQGIVGSEDEGFAQPQPTLPNGERPTINTVPPTLPPQTTSPPTMPPPITQPKRFRCSAQIMTLDDSDVFVYRLIVSASEDQMAYAQITWADSTQVIRLPIIDGVASAVIRDKNSTPPKISVYNSSELNFPSRGCVYPS